VRDAFVEGSGLHTVAKRFGLAESTLRYLCATGSWQLEREKLAKEKLEAARQLMARTPALQKIAPKPQNQAGTSPPGLDELNALVATLSPRDLLAGRAFPLYGTDGVCEETLTIQLNASGRTEVAIGVGENVTRFSLDAREDRPKIAAFIASRGLSLKVPNEFN
ncbi:MAG TPA: hypothetical protein VIR01_10735, partial [Pyrinomonadaceae bacterium]